MLISYLLVSKCLIKKYNKKKKYRSNKCSKLCSKNLKEMGWIGLVTWCVFKTTSGQKGRQPGRAHKANVVKEDPTHAGKTIIKMTAGQRWLKIIIKKNW